MPRRLLVAALALSVTAAGHLIGQTPPQPFDILIVNGRVLDGSGNPWMRLDVGIRGDRIAAIGRLAGQPAATTIDARGRIVAPGFMDVHSHALGGLTNPKLREGRALLAQGVTLVLGNPDGGGPTDLKSQAEELESDGVRVIRELVPIIEM